MSDTQPVICQCANLQLQINQLECRCISEFKSLANYQQNRSLAPFINRLNALEDEIRALREYVAGGSTV